MIAIDKAEKEAICARFSDVHIVRTMKQKSKRHRYYCAEIPSVVKFLSQIRNTGGNSSGTGNISSGKRPRRQKAGL